MKREILKRAGVSWRVQALETRRAVNVVSAAYTPSNQRTSSQGRFLSEAAWETRKRASRISNAGIAHGRIHTSNGQMTFIRREKRNKKSRKMILCFISYGREERLYHSKDWVVQMSVTFKYSYIFV